MKWADLLELVFVLLIVAALGIMWWPAAMLVGGLLGVLMCERRSAMTMNAKRYAEMKTRWDEIQQLSMEMRQGLNGVKPGPGRMV